MTAAPLGAFRLRNPAAGSTRIWDGSEPLRLHPRWLLDCAKDGRVRAREIAQVLNRPSLSADLLSTMRSSALQCEARIGSTSSSGVLALEGLGRIEITWIPLPVRIIATSAGSLAAADLLPDRDTVLSAEGASDRKFNRSTLRTFGTLSAVALLFSLQQLIFAPDQTATPNAALIPPQFAKLVLAKPKVQPKTASGSSSAKGPQAPAPRQARETRVSKALNGSRLQAAVTRLLKSNLHASLAGTDSLAARARSLKIDARTPAQSLVGAGKLGELMKGKGIEIAAIGGGGAGSGSANDAGGGGSGLGLPGYGTGSKAGINGQGSSRIALDLGTPSVEEGLTRDEVGRVIHAHMAEIRYCYESSMLHNPDLEGKLIMDFAVGASGSVTRSAIKDDAASDARLGSCLTGKLARWQFPKPRGGVTVAVTYPFIFKSLGRQ